MSVALYRCYELSLDSVGRSSTMLLFQFDIMWCQRLGQLSSRQYYLRKLDTFPTVIRKERCQRYNFPEDDEKKMVKEIEQFERYCNYGKNVALEQCQYSDRSGLMKNKLKHTIIMVHCSTSKHNVLKFPKYSEGCCDASEIKCIVNIKKNQLFLSLGRVRF